MLMVKRLLVTERVANGSKRFSRDQGKYGLFLYKLLIDIKLIVKDGIVALIDFVNNIFLAIWSYILKIVIFNFSSKLFN